MTICTAPDWKNREPSPLNAVRGQTTAARCVRQQILIQESCQIADVLRRSILKKAFSGQLVAQDPSDEPASVLLDQIKAERKEASKGRETTKRTRKKRKPAA